jgi:hypothetical protein
MKSDGIAKTTTVMLPEAVDIGKGMVYNVAVRLEGSSGTYYNENGLVQVVSGGVTVNFMSSLCSRTYSNVSRGQIPGLLLHRPTASLVQRLRTRYLTNLALFDKSTKIGTLVV